MEAGVRSLTESGACHPDDVRLAALSRFPWARQLVVDDFEFNQDANLHPNPTCLVTKELRSSTTVRLWRDEFGSRHPFGTDAKDTVLISHSASAEMGCYLALGWKPAARIYDTFVEARCHTNIATSKHDDRTQHCGLLDALAYFGIPVSRNRTDEEKTYWRTLFIDNGQWTPELASGGLNYCEDDVLDTEQLFYRLVPTTSSLAEAFNRSAAAKVEWVGVPIDMPTFRRWRQNREMLMHRLVEEVDRDFGIFIGTSINQQLFARWLEANGIEEWPLTSTGHLKTDKDTFKDYEGAHSGIERLKKLQKTISAAKNNGLEEAIGSDGRNRTSVYPFGASSSRNTPKAREFIFALAKWHRCMIKPEPGYSIASFDYRNQEIAIAAVLSEDRTMLEAYQTGDPHMAMAIQAGAAPANATKKTHRQVRSRFKAVNFCILYGGGPSRLARQIGIPLCDAQELHQTHRRIYPDYWRWIDRVGAHATLHNELQTRYGWKIRPVPMQRHNCPGVYTDPPNIRALCNFPMQSGGGEILREATNRLVADGVEVCALIHDAIVIVSPTSRFKEDTAKTLRAMHEASAEVLNGFKVDVEMTAASYPNTYVDEDGADMWNRLSRLISEAEAGVA
jgi:DNA polymerase family A